MSTLLNSIKRGCRTLVSRPVYLCMMVLVPLGVFFFFLDLMDAGLPLKAPTAVVDADHSSLSRQVTRSLESSELLDINQKLESYHEGIEKVRSGEIFGFFYIPADFERDAIAGVKPTLSYYSNMTYFVPGTLSFKGFKTTAVTVTGGIVVTTLASAGYDGDPMTIIQPLVAQDHPIGNPWLNYAYYLNNSFVPGVIALLVMMITVFSITEEMKRGTSVEWLQTSGGSMLVALVGKLLPQTVVFTVLGWTLQSLMYCWLNYPLNCPLGHMLLAMFLMVVACQAFALTVCELVPNLRIALSIVSLVGILSFSITGFSFPVQSMYGAVGIFSYIIPLRYYFLIYVDQALNGIPLYFSRFYYVALLVFLLVPFIGLRKLRNHCLNPVYIK